MLIWLRSRKLEKKMEKWQIRLFETKKKIKNKKLHRTSWPNKKMTI